MEKYFTLFRTKSFLIGMILCGLLLPATVNAQLPTAQQIASKMTIGLNLGNTLEAIGGETAWGAAVTS